MLMIRGDYMKKTKMFGAILIIILLFTSCSQKETDTMNNDKSTDTIPTEVPADPTSTPTPEPTPEPTPTEVPEIDYSDKKIVALTFDDGPNLEITPQILDILEEKEVVASFFLIGKYVTEDTKPVMERQLELDCEIANHSWNHNSMNAYTAEDNIDEIQRTNEIIEEMVGVTPKFFRPPFISTSPTMFEAIDLPFINGINCEDWSANITAEQRVERILTNVKDGDIVLLHDFNGNKNTVDALGEMIDGLIEDGYALVTVSKLFELKGVDPNQENKLWTNPSW